MAPGELIVVLSCCFIHLFFRVSHTVSSTCSPFLANALENDTSEDPSLHHLLRREVKKMAPTTTRAGGAPNREREDGRIGRAVSLFYLHFNLILFFWKQGRGKLLCKDR